MDSPYIGRIVAFVVTPIVTAAAAWFVPWAAENLPGSPAFDERELAAIGIAGILAIGGVIYKWLDNRGKHEQVVAQGTVTSLPGVPQTLTWNSETKSYESERV